MNSSVVENRSVELKFRVTVKALYTGITKDFVAQNRFDLSLMKVIPNGSFRLFDSNIADP